MYEINPKVAHEDIMEAVTELVDACIGRRQMTRKQELIFERISNEVKEALGLPLED